MSVMSKGVMWEMGAGYGVCEDRGCGKGGCEKEGLSHTHIDILHQLCTSLTLSSKYCTQYLKFKFRQ